MGCGCAAAGKAVAEYHNPDCSYQLGSGMTAGYSMGGLEVMAVYAAGVNC